MLSSFNNSLTRQFFAGVSASLGSFAVASLVGWVTPILPWLLGPDSEIPMTADEASWMISLPIITNILVMIPSGILSNIYGRKPIILLTGPLITLSWILVLYFKTLKWLLVARCLLGIATGVVFTVVPVYLGEISSNEYRGAITSLFFVLYWFGILFEYATGPFMSFTNYTLLTLSPSVLFFILFLFQPETPQFLVMKGKNKEAYKALRWLRCQPKEAIDREIEEMILHVQREKTESSAWLSILSSATDRKAIYLLLFITTVRLLSGTFSVVSYATKNFSRSRNIPLSPHEITIILGLALSVGACSSVFTIDFFGRRPVLIFSCFASAATLLTTAAYYYLDSYTSIDVVRFSWIAPVAIVIYAAVVVGGLFPVATTYTTELLTSKSRAAGSSLCSCLGAFWMFIILRFYQIFDDMFGVYFNFMIFGSVCLFGAIISFIVMPETKNKSFDQIRTELSTRARK